MARVIGNYECEWKVAIEDPPTLKRFRHFVNSERDGRQRGVRRGARADPSGDAAERARRRAEVAA